MIKYYLFIFNTQYILFALLTAIFVLEGCGNPLGSHSIVESSHSPGFERNHQIPLGRSAEIISSSAQMVLSKNKKFIYSGTLASPTNQVMMSSSTGNYILFSNSQGEFISSGRE